MWGRSPQLILDIENLLSRRQGTYPLGRPLLITKLMVFYIILSNWRRVSDRFFRGVVDYVPIEELMKGGG